MRLVLLHRHKVTFGAFKVRPLEWGKYSWILVERMLDESMQKVWPSDCGSVEKTATINDDRHVCILVGYNRKRTGEVGCKNSNKNHNNALDIFPCPGVAAFSDVLPAVWQATEEVRR